jgi:hypothetical protein
MDEWVLLVGVPLRNKSNSAQTAPGVVVWPTSSRHFDLGLGHAHVVRLRMGPTSSLSEQGASEQGAPPRLVPAVTLANSSRRRTFSPMIDAERCRSS